MANEEIKKDVTVDEAAEAKKTEEQQNAPAENNKEEKHPVKDFFKKNGKKIIGIGLGVVAAFGAGVAADKFGIKLPGKKKDPDAGETEE